VSQGQVLRAGVRAMSAETVLQAMSAEAVLPEARLQAGLSEALRACLPGTVRPLRSPTFRRQDEELARWAGSPP
jgi:hypothetical protein